MATTIPSVVQDDVISNVIVVDEADAGKIEVIASEDGVSSEITISSPIEGLNLGLKGEEKTEITGSRLTNASFINEAPKGKTANITLSVTKAASLEITSTGKGAIEFTAKEGKLLKPSITTAKGKAEDSISFGADSTLKAAAISTGKGRDTITFSGTLKGKTTVISGKGKDVIEVTDKKGKGKLVLSDFNKKDTLVVGDDTFTTKNLEEAPKWVKFDA
ncbi:hypothetical protein [Parasynechococcus marenigrum]|uniref:Uncharacterized protein n=1 Tax=Parasynechococcus marenigrum (strain WH8102) TaxID=84588 RepID=Q7U953_PARMW|nr:hypothetical protein [Parasynechococcus marenigrum]CAE06921.1 hypothetical [Parasynechococcus marenigrum WH 8102]